MFSGPVFIVGMPRSGTKLLRDLLNQHPQVGIPIVETHFIPYMIRQFGNPPNFALESDFDCFYESFSRTPFFWNMQKQGRVLKKRELKTLANLTSWASIFEVILRFYAPEGKEGLFIWGDKTPGYLNHILLLKSLYSQARFLHIIRDPRDYSLSVYKTWGKSLYRAAERWQATLSRIRPVGQQLGEQYKEVFFEALLTEPEKTLRDICCFLDCEFLPEMTTLNKPSENLGDAQGKAYIVQKNQQKYVQELSAIQVKRIEGIVYPMALALGYRLIYADAYRPLSPVMLKFLRLYDGYASLKFHIQEKGIQQGVNYFYKLHRRSSWREGSV